MIATAQPATHLEACPYCFADNVAAATVCRSCGACRRRAGGKWTSSREARRTDILVAGIALWFGLGLISLLLFGAVALHSSSTGTPTTVSTFHCVGYPPC